MVYAARNPQALATLKPLNDSFTDDQEILNTYEVSFIKLYFNP